VRVVLIRGAGERAFSSGSDVNSLAEYPGAWSFRDRVIYEATIRNIKKPVIAALKGWVLGGRAKMALAADMRVAGRRLADAAAHRWRPGHAAVYNR
jgi:enoyl-CoA hydratase/carnithine racemase